MKGIQDKIVLITGAATGIGKATAHAFLEFGATVAIADINFELAKQAEQELGLRCKAFEVDTGNEISISAMASNVIKEFGGVDILVNGAATFIMKGIEAGSLEWAQSNAVNIAGYALCAKYITPSMITRGSGSIINICSISAHIAQPSFLTYNAAKGAVASMTRCMALDLAKHKIRVNSISPGSVWTETSEVFHREQLNLTRVQAEEDPSRGGKHILRKAIIKSLLLRKK